MGKRWLGIYELAKFFNDHGGPMIAEFGEFFSIVWQAHGRKSYIEEGARKFASAFSKLLVLIVLGVIALIAKKGLKAVKSTKFWKEASLKLQKYIIEKAAAQAGKLKGKKAISQEGLNFLKPKRIKVTFNSKLLKLGGKNGNYTRNPGRCGKKTKKRCGY